MLLKVLKDAFWFYYMHDLTLLSRALKVVFALNYGKDYLVVSDTNNYYVFD